MTIWRMTERTAQSAVPVSHNLDATILDRDGNERAKARTFGGEGGLGEVEEAETFAESAHLLD